MSDATGLMWENAEAFGAVLVFAEHRFYGASQPAPQPAPQHHYLSHELALADYATLLTQLQVEHTGQQGEVLPAVSFGGSYGGA